MQLHQPSTDSALPLPNYRSTNDLEVNDRYVELLGLHEAPPGPGECAVVVGPAGLLSSADALPGTVYVADKDTKLLDWMARSVEGMRVGETRTAYRKEVDNPRMWFTSEHDIFGDRHFLSSEERYAQAREALLKRSVAFVAMNFAEPAEVASLADLLVAEAQQVCVFNATNMHRHITGAYGLTGLEEYLRSLERLPWASDFRIMASAVEMLVPRSFPLQSTLEGYAQLARSANPHSSAYVAARLDKITARKRVR